MSVPQPPSVATWLLQHLGWLGYDNDPLAGDLLEEFREGRTAQWYWRQVMAAIVTDVPRQIWAHRTFGVLAMGVVCAFWLANNIPVPGVNAETLALLLASGQTGDGFTLYNLFSGGNLGRVTIFALGIMPYMTALTIRWIALFIWPSLVRASQDVGRGRSRDMAYARYGGVVLSIVQSLAIAVWLEQQTTVAGGLPLVSEPGWIFRLTLVLALTTTTACLIWLGEQITRRGIGWGASLVVFAGTVVGLPGVVTATLNQMQAGAVSLRELVWFVLLMAVNVALVLLVDPGRRPFPRSAPG